MINSERLMTMDSGFQQYWERNYQNYQNYAKALQDRHNFRRHLNQLESKVQHLKEIFEKSAHRFRAHELKSENTTEEGARKKRPRRLAKHMERKFTCPTRYCTRVYGTENSLKQHYRLKHSQLGDYVPIKVHEEQLKKDSEKVSICKEKSQKEAQSIQNKQL